MRNLMNQSDLALELEEEQEILEALDKDTLKRSKSFKKDMTFAKKPQKISLRKMLV